MKSTVFADFLLFAKNLPNPETTLPGRSMSSSTTSQQQQQQNFISLTTFHTYCPTKTTRMWANVQRDGRSAYYRWRPLLNAAVWLTPSRPLLACRAVTLPRRETRWNLQGCPKLANSSQPLVGRSSPYYEDMWRMHRCLTSFSYWRYMP